MNKAKLNRVLNNIKALKELLDYQLNYIERGLDETNGEFGVNALIGIRLACNEISETNARIQKIMFLEHFAV